MISGWIWNGEWGRIKPMKIIRELKNKIRRGRAESVSQDVIDDVRRYIDGNLVLYDALFSQESYACFDAAPLFEPEDEFEPEESLEPIESFDAQGDLDSDAFSGSGAIFDSEMHVREQGSFMEPRSYGYIGGKTASSRSAPKSERLEDIIAGVGMTFQQSLLGMIDRKGLTDALVYRRANLDRRLFSKIRCNENYKPSKSTALALAIALELNLDETTDLLGRAGLALSPSSISDLIVRYCIENRIYDIYEVNAILYEYDQQLLGN